MANVVLFCMFQSPYPKARAQSHKRWVSEAWPGGRGHRRWGYNICKGWHGTVGIWGEEAEDKRLGHEGNVLCQNRTRF